MTNNSFTFQVPLLNKSKYDNWSIRTRTRLGAQNVWEIVRERLQLNVNEVLLSQTQKDSLTDLRNRNKKTI